ncbi:damage-inducible mutagenesis protein, partial [Rhizobium ruizarguesonis]
SEELPVAGVGRPRWLGELMRVNAGECAEFELGACDAKGRLCLHPLSVNRPDTSARRGNRAS